MVVSVAFSRGVASTVTDSATEPTASLAGSVIVRSACTTIPGIRSVAKTADGHGIFGFRVVQHNRCLHSCGVHRSAAIRLDIVDAEQFVIRLRVDSNQREGVAYRSQGEPARRMPLKTPAAPRVISWQRGRLFPFESVPKRRSGPWTLRAGPSIA